MSRPSSSVRPAAPSVRPRRPLARWAGLAAVALAVGLAVRAQAAGSLADLDRDNGLPEARLGAPITSFQGLVKTEDVGRWLTFKRPTDTLRYGKYAVKAITYNFFKDQLYSINLDLEGKGNIRGIASLLEKTYGKDHTNDQLPIAKLNDYMTVREWAGTRVYCVMKNGSDETGGVLTLLDKPTWDRLQVPKLEKLKATQQMLGGSFVNGDLDKKAAPTETPAPAAVQPAAPEPGSLPGNPLLPPPRP